MAWTNNYLIECKLTSYERARMKEGVEGAVEILNRLQIREFLTVAKCKTINGNRSLKNYLNILILGDLDIGKGGNHKYGYRTPTPIISAIHERELRIFRRF